MALKIVNDGNPISWEEFEKHVLADIETAKLEKAEAKNKAGHSDWIYRGQSNAEWPLDTSLERYIKSSFNIESLEYYPVEKYYRYLGAVIPAVNSFLDKSFEEMEELKIDCLGTMPHYSLLCFVRHLGFPSPLLDWTISPYVAAFFAFRDATSDQNISIYSYKEYTGNIRSWDPENPIIDEHGSHVKTHLRHYKQQSRYTVCRAEKEDQVVFMNHEVAISREPHVHPLKKFILSSSEKEKVLHKLNLMNINDYTLFGDDESLMRTLAFKEAWRLKN